MPITSYFRSPLTDIFGPLANNQCFGPCGDLEMKHVNCLEAYGEDRAAEKCQDLLHDLFECMSRNIEMDRVVALKQERERQIKLGIRSENYIDGPAHDSYEFPTLLK